MVFPLVEIVLGLLLIIGIVRGWSWYHNRVQPVVPARTPARPVLCILYDTSGLSEHSRRTMEVEHPPKTLIRPHGHAAPDRYRLHSMIGDCAMYRHETR